VKLTKPTYRRTKNIPSPTYQVLLKGEARVLYHHWRATGDKASVDRRLAVIDKVYGAGAQQRVRMLMRDIKRETET
jgi:hypothetical protein